MIKQILTPEERVVILERIKTQINPLTMKEVSELHDDPILKKAVMAIKMWMLQVEKEAIQAELEKISDMDNKLS